MPIPETIDLGAYTVSLKLSDGWGAEVQKANGFVRFSLDDRVTSAAVQLSIFRVKVKDELFSSDTTELAKRLIIEDGLKFKKFVYGRSAKITLTADKRANLSSPLGEVRCFEFARDQYGPAGRLFTKVALIIPRDFSQRRIVYLVTGYESSNTENPRHLRLVEKIVAGLRESSPTSWAEAAKQEDH